MRGFCSENGAKGAVRVGMWSGEDDLRIPTRVVFDYPETQCVAVSNGFRASLAVVDVRAKKTGKWRRVLFSLYDEHDGWPLNRRKKTKLRLSAKTILTVKL